MAFMAFLMSVTPVFSQAENNRPKGGSMLLNLIIIAVIAFLIVNWVIKNMSKVFNQLMPEDFGKSLDEALFFEWKESVKKLNKSLWIQTGLIFLGILPGILFAIIDTTKKNKKALNLQTRLGITKGDIKQAKVNCKNRIKMRR